MSIMFVIAQIISDNSIVDIAWGIGFILVTTFALISNGLYETRHMILWFLITVWGLRLSFHILSRHKGEDWRYANWRKTWKHFILRSYLQVFMLQGLCMFIIVIAALYSFGINGPQLMWLDYIGLIVWLIGFLFETIGDAQLDDFIKNKKSLRNKICKVGLWKYTRHPNYFGEATMWWGIFLIAFAGTGNWLLIISPITITYLVRFVSGVPMLEEKYMKSKEFQKYAKKTNVFFPLPPRN